MPGESLQHAALWLYRRALATGLLSTRPGRRMFGVAYTLYKRHVEDPFYHLTRTHPELFTGGHIIDVGANIGYTAGVFAAAIGESGFRVWAFEPASDNFRQLQESIVDRRLQHAITARHAAVADVAGTVDLLLNPDHPADHRVLPPGAPPAAAGRVSERVRVTTIDDEVRANSIAPVAFIKIDVQGAEFQVCLGMTATLDANPSAAVVLEYAPALLSEYGNGPQTLVKFFADRGYHAYRLTRRGGLAAIGDRDWAPAVPSGYMDVLFTRAVQETTP